MLGDALLTVLIGLLTFVENTWNTIWGATGLLSPSAQWAGAIAVIKSYNRIVPVTEFLAILNIYFSVITVMWAIKGFKWSLQFMRGSGS